MGLTSKEYEIIVEKLGRLPNYAETGMFSVLWSEHCCYKSSKHLLKLLPTSSSKLLIGPGEGAGVIDIGDEECVVFKIESHNHPSAVEPYQGAATGVGGILRDIFSMGARPIALLNSLHFGNLKIGRTKYLFERVVEGISGYGNCIGIPTVGGQIQFDESYQENPLVNVMCVGFAKQSEIMTSAPKEKKLPIFYLGAKTGRDGIHGATFASTELNEDSDKNKPNVQVGDPFTGKLLMEATLELCKKGVLSSLQDMGAAGLTCSISEMAHKGNCGMSIDLNLLPLQSEQMSGYEILLSESQERMLLAGKIGFENQILEICKNWNIDCVQIGSTTETSLIEIYYQNEKIVNLPVELLCENTPSMEVSEFFFPNSIQKSISNSLLESFSSFEDLFLSLISDPNHCSKKWVTTQYDSTIGLRNVYLNPSADACILMTDHETKAIATTLDCNSYYIEKNPYRGSLISTMEAARNLACVGAHPLGITDGLNFGNPHNDEIYRSMRQSILGIKDACIALEIPVVGGNVSLYNESLGKAIKPTPIIGMAGLVHKPALVPGNQFKNIHDHIFLLGNTKPEYGVSAIQRIINPNFDGEVPTIDLELEKTLHRTLITLIEEGLLCSAHDISDGGIALALFECCTEELGCDISFHTPARLIEALFSESQSRAIVSVADAKINSFFSICESKNQPAIKIGNVNDGFFKIQINGENIINKTTKNLIELSESILPQVFSN